MTMIVLRFTSQMGDYLLIASVSPHHLFCSVMNQSVAELQVLELTRQ